MHGLPTPHPEHPRAQSSVLDNFKHKSGSKFEYSYRPDRDTYIIEVTNDLAVINTFLNTFPTHEFEPIEPTDEGRRFLALPRHMLSAPSPQAQTDLVTRLMDHYRPRSKLLDALKALTDDKFTYEYQAQPTECYLADPKIKDVFDRIFHQEFNVAPTPKGPRLVIPCDIVNTLRPGEAEEAIDALTDHALILFQDKASDAPKPPIRIHIAKLDDLTKGGKKITPQEYGHFLGRPSDDRIEAGRGKSDNLLRKDIKLKLPELFMHMRMARQDTFVTVILTTNNNAAFTAGLIAGKGGARIPEGIPIDGAPAHEHLKVSLWSINNKPLVIISLLDDRNHARHIGALKGLGYQPYIAFFIEHCLASLLSQLGKKPDDARNLNFYSIEDAELMRMCARFPEINGHYVGPDFSIIKSYAPFSLIPVESGSAGARDSALTATTWLDRGPTAEAMRGGAASSGGVGRAASGTGAGVPPGDESDGDPRAVAPY